MKTPEIISKHLKDRLSPIAHLFQKKTYLLSELHGIKPASFICPGVYIFSRNNQVIRIGKSKTNCIKRSLEHIRDNTRGGEPFFEMKSLIDDETCTVSYIFTRDTSAYFWVSSIEYFFEENLSPLIPSKRNG